MERDYVSGTNKKKTDKFKSRETFNVNKMVDEKGQQVHHPSWLTE